MHPDVCEFVSTTMYDGRLESEPECAEQEVLAQGPLGGTGLRFLSVDHEGNRQSAPEEAALIAAEVERLLTSGARVRAEGKLERPLTLDDLLVVAPCNAQVRCLRAVLPHGARVGTVDKFHGQEAPIVFSMTSSTGEDVPRGMDFLFSRNRPRCRGRGA